MKIGALRMLACCSAAGVFACAASPVAMAPREPTPPRPAAAPGPAPAPELAPAPADPGPPGLSFAVEPADALVLIDGAAFGTISGLPGGRFVSLQPGLYQVVLKRSGYATWRAEVSVRLGTELIRVSLRKAP